jgi:hypothetical protein
MRRVALSLSIALALSAFIASPASAARAFAVTSTNQLIAFDTASPATITSTVAITGLNAGENVLGIDVRPANNTMYAVGSAGRLYTVNTATGAATFVAAIAPAPAGTSFGVDFNPAADRLRITSDTDQNLRVVPDTGVTTVDVALQYAVGDPNAAANPNVTASGYTNSFQGTTTTTLYGIDTNLDILVMQNPPNNGTLVTIGALGQNTGANTGFDILAPGLGGGAFAALSTGAGSSLYSINLGTGTATLIGAIGNGSVVVTGFALGNNPTDVPTMATWMLIMLAAALIAVAGWVLKR